MAFLFADGFDWMANAINDLPMRWTSSSSGLAVVAAANTAFGVGGALAVNSGSGISWSKSAWGSNDATIFGTIRHKFLGGSSSGLFSSLQLQDSGASQVTLQFNEDGSIAVRTGPSAAEGGTTISVFAGVHSISTWDSFQFKIVIHNTTGSVEVRKNGSATPIINLTNVNTRGGTTNAYANGVKFYYNGTGNAHQFDDLMLCSSSGAVPNDWLGDLRCWPNTPNGTAQGQWSIIPSPGTFGQTSNPTTVGSQTNGIFYVSVTAPYAGTVNSVQFSLTTAQTGGVNGALYSDVAGAPGSLLAQSTGVTSPPSGPLVFTFASPPTVTKGQALWIAVWTATSNTYNGASTGVNRALQTLTYTGTFPSTAGGAVTLNASAPYAIASITLASNVQAVNETAQDGDTSYVYSSTVGQEDLYSFPTLASQSYFPQSIVGVVPFAIMKKSDAGARTVSVRCKSGSTDVAAITDAAVPNNYAHRSGMLTTDPNTSAAWTATGVNAATVGVKLDA